MSGLFDREQRRRAAVESARGQRSEAWCWRPACDRPSRRSGVRSRRAERVRSMRCPSARRTWPQWSPLAESGASTSPSSATTPTTRPQWSPLAESGARDGGGGATSVRAIVPQWSPLAESGARRPGGAGEGRAGCAAVESARGERSETDSSDGLMHGRSRRSGVRSRRAEREDVGSLAQRGHRGRSGVRSRRAERGAVKLWSLAQAGLPQWSPLAESGARSARGRVRPPGPRGRSGVRSRRAERAGVHGDGARVGQDAAVESARGERSERRAGSRPRRRRACRSGVRSRRAERGVAGRDEGGAAARAAVESARGERSESRVVTCWHSTSVRPQWSPLAESGARPVPTDRALGDVGAAVESARGERSELHMRPPRQLAPRRRSGVRSRRAERGSVATETVHFRLDGPQWSPLAESGASPARRERARRAARAAVESARGERSEPVRADPSTALRLGAAVESACGERSESTLRPSRRVSFVSPQWSPLAESGASLGDVGEQRVPVVPQWSPLAESGASAARRRPAGGRWPRRSGVRSRRAERDAEGAGAGRCWGCRSGVRSRRAERGPTACSLPVAAAVPQWSPLAESGASGPMSYCARSSSRMPQWSPLAESGASLAERHVLGDVDALAAVESARGERSEAQLGAEGRGGAARAAVESARGERSEGHPAPGVHRPGHRCRSGVRSRRAERAHGGGRARRDQHQAAVESARGERSELPEWPGPL